MNSPQAAPGALPAAPSRPVSPSKSRLPVLDGLRGVAALIVVAYHIFDSDPVNSVYHGYLAVDFFFMLSGYVMGYAYDDRWGAMSAWSFFKRRLVRLHPMVVIGSFIGVLFFYFSGSSLFGLVHQTSWGALLLAAVLGALLIPSPKSMDVRGWGESYPLNGPEWSLFFEYIANVGYAFGFRRFSLRALGILSAAFAGVLAGIILSSANGSVGCGWLLTPEHVSKGMVRMLFPFLAGLFLFRLGRTFQVRHAMLYTSLALLIALPMPRVGPASMPWLNGLYECGVLFLLMPAILLAGAGSRPVTRAGEKFCEFLGDLSYPLYLVHYPIHYVFYGWLSNHNPPWSLKIPVAIGVYALSLAVACLVMRFLDTPIRNRLARFTR